MNEELAWTSLRWPGVELAETAFDQGCWRVDSAVLLVLGRKPYRVTYQISSDSTWRTRGFTITLTSSGTIRSLSVEADGDGHWFADDGGRLAALDGCIDLDISITPLTNTLPIRRLALAAGASQGISAAYLRIPELTLSKAAQRYTYLGDDAQGKRFHYESGSFRADLRVDAADYVSDYPGVWRRVQLADSRVHA